MYALRQVFELSKKYLRGFGQSFDLVTGNHDLEVGHMFDAFGRIFDMFPRPRTRHLRFSLPLEMWGGVQAPVGHAVGGTVGGGGGALSPAV